MSIKMLSWAFEQDLPCAEKFVLVALADMADMDGKCWPSQSCLAKRCGIARETVNRQIAMLVNAGMLRVEQRTNSKGKQANIYFVRCDAGSHPDVTQDHTSQGVCDPGSHRNVTDDHIEPSREPSEVRKKGSLGADAPKGADAPFGFPDFAGKPEPDVRATVFSLGKDILGRNAGGLVRKLIDCHAGDEEETLDTLLRARRKDDPRSYLGRILAGERPETDWEAVYRRMGVRD